MSKQFAPNIFGWKIRTNEGFVSFAGISTMGHKQLHRVTFGDGTSIEATSNHVFFDLDGNEVRTDQLTIGQILLGIDDKTIVEIAPTTVAQTYDIVESKTHTFFANGVLCHNCLFISSDPLLIDPMILSNLSAYVKTIEPVGTSGELMFFDEIRPDTTYLVGMDAATGSGNDYTVIEVFEFPELVQVAEFRSNTMSSVLAYQTLKRILNMLEKTKSTVYFSVENNGVGEAILALYEADEHPPQHSELITGSKQNREGMTTTGRSKIKSCLQFKELVERNQITIKSKLLALELQNFIRARGSYAAKNGSTDDAIMATVIVIRMLAEIASYEQAAFDRLYTHEYEGDYDEGINWSLG